MPRKQVLLLTCEHASNRIPLKYKKLFPSPLLKTHRAYDIGAAGFALRLGTALHSTPLMGSQSRLLADLNRSLHNRKKLFSPYLKSLECSEKESILKKYYFPFRNSVERKVRSETGKRRQVLHLSLHSFTPVLNGKVRPNDIGLLFDPSRKSEKRFCLLLKNRLNSLMPDLKVRFNVPYKGTDDGHTTYLRRMFSDSRYAGIEIEINQKFPLKSSSEWKKLQDTLIRAIESVC